MRFSSARHGRPSAAILRWLLLIVAVLAPLLIAMRCANEDLSGEFQLQLVNDGQSELIGLEVPYTGRLALDVGVDAAQSGEILLRVQAQTSGDPDVLGCDAITLGRVRDTQANPWDGNTPPSGSQGTHTTISNVAVRTGVALNHDAANNRYTGILELAIPRTLVRVYTTNNDILLWDLDGNIVPPIEATRSASCEGIFVTVYELPADRTRIGYRSSSSRVEQAIVEDCTAQRVVQRVCAGSSGPQEDHRFSVEGGTRHVERLAQLGVGDTLVLEASCQGACPATLSAFAWVEPLDCRTRNDCSGGRFCTNDGYCIKEPAPSCAWSGGASANRGQTPYTAQTLGLLGLLTLSSLLRLRRRRRAQ